MQEMCLYFLAVVQPEGLAESVLALVSECT